MTTHALSQAILQARDEAKALLKALEGTGHPQTNESSGLYLGLVTLHKRLAAGGAGARPDDFAADLEQLRACCTGKLKSIAPRLDAAVRLARARRARG